MPAAEVEVDEPLVRALLRDQAPDLAQLPLNVVSFGWDNVIFRLGDEFAVRLPRRALAAPLVEHEQRWLPLLAPRLPLPIPAPLRAGEPACGYPWHWSVCPWLRGERSSRAAPDDLPAAAATLGAFVRALHQPAPHDAPANPFRGIPLADRSPSVFDTTPQVDVDQRAVLDLWAELVDTPRWDGPPMWLHGDLHPANVLVHDGVVSAVIDFGDITAGDPATDLSVGWMMFDRASRLVFRAAAGDVDDHTWARARGWAISLGLVYVANSADNPEFTALGRRVVAAALEGD